MDLHQLRVFHAAVKSGGFTRAGDELHLSQSTVSQHIKLMEEELGGPLFMRVGKRVLVTEAGSVLLQHTERILRDIKNAEMAIREINSLRRGTVRLGVGPTTLIYRLPHVLRDYKLRFPDIDLIVLAGTTEFLLEALRTQHLDLAIIMKTAPQPGLTITPLGSEELVLVLNREHPLARQRTVEPSDLAGLRFILYEKNTAMQDLIDRFFESLGVTPRIDMEVENNEAIKSLVRVGLGASILPLCAVAKEPPESPLRILRVKGKPLMRELRLASAGTEILPNAIRELSAALQTALCHMKPGPARTRRRGDRSPAESIAR
jgi:LysR family transcriptional activator of glutamate synthase operon